MGIGAGTAALIGGGLAAAGGIGSAIIGSNAAGDAAQAQTQSDQAAIAEQQREFNINQANFAPYLAAGTGALGQLDTLMGLNGNDALQKAIAALQASPLYTSLFNQGNQTILQDASATGGLRGGNTQRSLADFGSSLLSSVIQNQIGNLSGLAGLGEGATAQMGTFGQNNANAISSLMQATGNAKAGAAATQGGIWTGLGNNLMGTFSSPQFLTALGGLFGGSNSPDPALAVGLMG